MIAVFLVALVCLYRDAASLARLHGVTYSTLALTAAIVCARLAVEAPATVLWLLDGLAALLTFDASPPALPRRILAR